MSKKDLEWAEEAVHYMLLRCATHALSTVLEINWLKEINALSQMTGKENPSLGE